MRCILEAAAVDLLPLSAVCLGSGGASLKANCCFFPSKKGKNAVSRLLAMAFNFVAGTIAGLRKWQIGYLPGGISTDIGSAGEDPFTEVVEEKRD